MDNEEILSISVVDELRLFELVIIFVQVNRVIVSDHSPYLIVIIETHLELHD
jgi:hypothetical protein